MKNFRTIPPSKPINAFMKPSLPVLSLLVLTQGLALAAHLEGTSKSRQEITSSSASLSLPLEQVLNLIWTKGVEGTFTNPPHTNTKRNLDKTLILGGAAAQPM